MSTTVDTTGEQTAEQQARAALDAFIAKHDLPAPAGVSIQKPGGYLGPMHGFMVQPATIADVNLWAEVAGVGVGNHDGIQVLDDGSWYCVRHRLLRGPGQWGTVTLPGVPLPVYVSRMETRIALPEVTA